MRHLSRILLPVLVLLMAATPVAAAGLTTLATCTSAVLKEISRTRQWTGKAPVGCPAQIAVEKRQDGIFVTAWTIENAGEGWIRTAFSTAAGYAEMADRRMLVKASRDIMARAGRLSRCLSSVRRANDPGECQSRATKSYLAGETTGTENDRLLWLDDNGRHAIVQHTVGDAEATPAPPADLYESPPLPPMVIELRQ